MPLPSRRNAPFVTHRAHQRTVTSTLEMEQFEKFDGVCEQFNLAPGTLSRLVLADIGAKPEAWQPTIKRLLAEERAKR